MKSRLLAAFAPFLLLSGTALADQVMVLEVKGAPPGLAPGALVDGSQVTLPGGAEATFMAADGQVVRVLGPYTGPAESGAASGGVAKNTLTALASLMEKSAEKSTLGATRAIGFPAPKSYAGGDPWVIDASHGGTRCVFADHPAKIWLDLPATPATLTLEDEKSHAKIDIPWPMGQDRVDWPAELPLVGGDHYAVTTSTGHRKLLVKLLPAAASPGAASIAAAGAGCAAQATAIAKDLKPTKTIGG